MRGLFWRIRRGRVESEGRKYQYLLPARSVPVGKSIGGLGYVESGGEGTS